MKIVLLNGAPYSGKDTLGNMLVEYIRGATGQNQILSQRPGVMVTAKNAKFSAELKVRTHASYRLFDRDGEPLPHDAYESCKDKPHVDFRGRMPREAYIMFSEGYYKPLHGEGIFGELLCESLDNDSNFQHRGRPFSEIPTWVRPIETFYAITDSGFLPEAKVIVERVGLENCLLARVRADKRGKTFKGDSRGFWPNTLGLKEISVDNQIQDDLTGLVQGQEEIISWLTSSEPREVTRLDLEGQSD